MPLTMLVPQHNPSLISGNCVAILCQFHAQKSCLKVQDLKHDFFYWKFIDCFKCWLDVETVQIKEKMYTLYGKGYPTVPILHVFNYVQKVCGGSNPCSTNFLPNVQAREGGVGGQTLFEQCYQKLRNSWSGASLNIPLWVLAYAHSPLNRCRSLHL